MDGSDISKCERCGGISYSIFDKSEMREENNCLNKDCGYFFIDFEKGNYDEKTQTWYSDFDPHSVNEHYSEFLNNLECEENDNSTLYWGSNSPSEVMDFIEKEELEEFIEVHGLERE